MRTTQLFPSKYIKSDDLADGPQTVAIRELVIEEIGQGKNREDKPVLYFQDRTKGLVLNVTNCRAIEDAYGTETDDWPDNPVELFSTKVDFKGDRVDAVRVRVPQEPSAADLVEAEPATKPKKSKKAAAEAEKAELDGELDDEVPF